MPPPGPATPAGRSPFLADLPWPEVLRQVRGGVRSVSPSGILGNPAGATAAAGQALPDTLAGAPMSQVRDWYPEAA